MIHWAHPSPQPKRHLDRFSCFCTDDQCSYTVVHNGTPLPPSKLPLPMGDLKPPSNTWFLGPPSPDIKRHLDRFSRFCRAHYSVADRQTNRPWTLRGRQQLTTSMYVVRAMRSNNNCFRHWWREVLFRSLFVCLCDCWQGYSQNYYRFSWNLVD